MTLAISSFASGRPFLLASAWSLIAAGVFAVALGVAGQFLPHDERFLGMTAQELCALHECRIVHFMIHDRISFGGVLIAIGLLYRWLTNSPLRDRERWAWWALTVSGIVGFGSFFAYLGYGYLDTWNGLATLALLPCFVVGLMGTYPTLSSVTKGYELLIPSTEWRWNSRRGVGMAFLLASATGIAVGGSVICVLGMTVVFVPEDLGFLGVNANELHAINERLVPLIAHDRAGFGGALVCCGITLLFCLWFARPSPDFWRMLATVGVTGYGTAIGVHPAIGYNDAFHLAPAVVGASLYLAGLILTFPHMAAGTSNVIVALPDHRCPTEPQS